VVDEGRPVELQFALVRAVGTPIKEVEGALQRSLVDARLLPVRVRVSDHIAAQQLVSPFASGDFADEYDRYDRLMTAGDVVRSCTDRSDAAAALAVEAIRDRREGALEEAARRGARGVAFVIRSLMHPAEIGLLRDLYGPTFFVISAYADEERRRRQLTDELQDAAVRMDTPVERLVDALMARDRGRAAAPEPLLSSLMSRDRHKHLSLDKTFDQADFFLDTMASDQHVASSVRRFVSLVMGSPFETPMREEMGMAHAFAARRRSASMSRQVGAAVCDADGNVVATGMNDVPRAGGGQYWPGDPDDNRDHVRGEDTSDSIRREVFADLLQRLASDLRWVAGALGWDDANAAEALSRVLGADAHEFGDAAQRTSALEMLQSALSDLAPDVAVSAALASPVVRAADFFDVIEYGRAVHAEMACICFAASEGVSLYDSTLYTTTFPCHECARLIVACGIKRVVYVEPYPKSRVARLYADSIRLAHSGQPGDEDDTRVVFEPFIGVAPRRHEDLFSWVPRKLEDVDPSVDSRLSGRIVEWSLETGELRPSVRAGRSADSDEVRRAAVLGYEKRVVEDINLSLSRATDKYLPAVQRYLDERAERYGAD